MCQDEYKNITLSQFYYTRAQVSYAKMCKQCIAGKLDTKKCIANSILLRLAELTQKQQRNVNAHGLGGLTCAQIVKLLKVGKTFFAASYKFLLYSYNMLYTTFDLLYQSGPPILSNSCHQRGKAELCLVHPKMTQ